MALVWADSFTRYGTSTAGRTAMYDTPVYAVLTGYPLGDPDPNAAAGSRCFRCSVDNWLWYRANRIALPNPTTLVGVAQRVWMYSLPSDNDQRKVVAGWSTASNGALAHVIVEVNGSISAYKGFSAGSAGTLLATTTVPVVSANAWHHIEAFYDASTGEGSVYVNGINRLNFTGGNTGTIGNLVHAGSLDGSGSDHLMKDYVIWDGTGTDVNSVVGTQLVGRFNPNGDVALGGWIPSAGSTGYNLLAKSAPDDASYLSADDTPPAAMQFDFANLPTDVTSVLGLITVVRARKVDGGDADLQVSLESNGSQDNGANRPITSAFAYWFDVSTIDPDTAAAWTPGKVDSATIITDRTV